MTGLKVYFPVSRDTDWEAVFAESSSPFSAESSGKLAELIEESVSISGISNYLSELLPVLLSSGTPEAALTQFLDFSKSYQKKFKKVLTGVTPIQSHWYTFSDEVISWLLDLKEIRNLR